MKEEDKPAEPAKKRVSTAGS